MYYMILAIYLICYPICNSLTTDCFFLQPNMTHYLMVAKLSNRFFNRVLEIPEPQKVQVTQSNFTDLYGKS